MNPLQLSYYTLTTCLGGGLAANLSALREQRIARMLAEGSTR